MSWWEIGMVAVAGTMAGIVLTAWFVAWIAGRMFQAALDIAWPDPKPRRLGHGE